MKSLMLVKILEEVKEEEEKKEPGIEGKTFRVNPKFAHTYMKLRLPVCAEAKPGVGSEVSSEVNKTLQKERVLKIDIAIIKIMKARREVEHNTLVTDAIKMLSSSFSVDATIIKGRIEHLIETDYIDRSATNKKIYIYKA